MSQKKTTTRPYCFSCRYFYITHEQNTPYGCRALGFKSAQNPALVVAKSSGLECQLFAPKGQGDH